ncbi:MAG: SIMPL domain-containing protein [Ilumatobacteraceae bacterium]
MADTVITVRGSFDSYFPPERATVNLLIGHHGRDKNEVYNQTTTSAGRATEIVGGITDAEQGPVTWWSSDRVRTWSEKPWNKDGKQLPLVFHAVVGVEAKFKDFVALARFIDEVVVLPGVSVRGLTWALTEARKREVVREARQRAVRDATERAADYASAAGLTTVTVSAVADVGMLGGDTNYTSSGSNVAFARAAAAPGGSGEAALDLTPSDVAISAQVDARFTAT